PVTNASAAAPVALIRDGNPVMSGKARERDLEHDLAGPLRPTLIPLGLLEALQLAADIDQHAGELRSHGFERTRYTLLGGDDVVAHGSGIGRSGAPRTVRRRECGPVRRHPRAQMGEPIIGAEAFTG